MEPAQPENQFGKVGLPQVISEGLQGKWMGNEPLVVPEVPPNVLGPDHTGRPGLCS
jgi:hypothetical protein